MADFEKYRNVIPENDALTKIDNAKVVILSHYRGGRDMENSTTKITLYIVNKIMSEKALTIQEIYDYLHECGLNKKRSAMIVNSLFENANVEYIENCFFARKL